MEQRFVQPGSGEDVNEHGLSGMLGTVDWEIVETSAGETVHCGSREIWPGDIEVIKVVPLPDRIRQVRSHTTPGWRIILSIFSVVVRGADAMAGLVTGGRRNLYRNRVNLDENFHVELVDRPVARHGALTGFGLTAGCETTPTSSWEWFDVANAQEYATKLQEDGELRIRLKKARYGDWEVKYTEFLTDVSLRIEPEQGTGRRDPRSRWCVRIAEGFRLSWPSADEAR